MDGKTYKHIHVFWMSAIHADMTAYLATTGAIDMSRTHNPAHPGEVLREWLPEGMTITLAAKELQISRVTLSKVLNGKASMTAGMMALRLSLWLGTTPDVWLEMQTQ